MNEAASSKDRLFDEALDLVIRLQNDPGNRISWETARRWRARGLDHEDAWRRAIEVHALTGAVLARSRTDMGAPRPGLSRRHALTGGMAATAALAAAALFGPGLLVRARADYTTDAGQTRRIDLPDGSTAILGPASALALGFGTVERRVDLLAGMMFVEAIANESRPFQAIVGPVKVTAGAAAFDLSRDGDYVTIAVEHGTAAIAASALTAGVLSLAAGQWATIQGDGQDVERGTRAIADLASWKTGRLIVEDEPIAIVVARIARWQPGRVLVADPSLGAQRVSGVFDLHQPLRALEAAVRPYGGRVRRFGSLLTLISPL